MFLSLLTFANLRAFMGSGRIFAIPTYFFVVCIFFMITVGLYRYAYGTVSPLVVPRPANASTRAISMLLLLTAFANGCTAMTGVEAVSDGVPAFRPPESKNAA